MEFKSNFSKSMPSFYQRISVFFFLGFFLYSPLFSQLPTAQEIASQMTLGWNLGNTLEAICAETAWGNPKTTQKLIDSIKTAGYDAVRLPCAWDCHSTNGVINAAWIARVKEVVDYCINDSMYVILNIHWDGGWLENNVTLAAQETVNEKQHNYWTQIAAYFKDYDEHLLFASANEPNVENASGMAVLMTYHQTFINAVRATGANNSSRTLVIQGPSTDIEKTNNLMQTLPVDSIADRLIFEVHYYTPWQFCGLTQDASWGRMFYYWGRDYHSTTDASRNATWGEEAELDRLLGLMKTKFVDKGIPVILGEYGAVKRTLGGNSDQALHLASRLYFYRYFVESAVTKGIIPFNWDTGPYGNNTMGIFDRNSGAVADQGLLDSIMVGAGKKTITDIPGESLWDIPTEIRLGQNYPNPFNPETTIEYSVGTQHAVSVEVNLSIYNLLGQKVATLVKGQQNTGNHTVRFVADNLQSGIYFYRLETPLGNETRKLFLLK